MIYVGRHLSISKGIKNTIENAIKNKLMTCQIFIGNSRGASLSKISDSEKKDIKDLVDKSNFKLQVHLKYLYNLSKQFDPNAWHIKTILKEIKLADDIGALNGVCHCGKAVELNTKDAIKNFITAVRYIVQFIKKNNLKIKFSIETSCNQGTELFYKLEDFADMFNTFTLSEKKHISVTLDTCHLFVAGHNLVKDSDKIFNYVKKNIGFKNVGLIHLNDSKNECGKKVDRHADIGKGYIGYKTLLKWSQFGHNNNIPVILETPTGKEKECLDLIKNLKKTK